MAAVKEEHRGDIPVWSESVLPPLKLKPHPVTWTSDILAGQGCSIEDTVNRVLLDVDFGTR